jgi:hypothetical protein
VSPKIEVSSDLYVTLRGLMEPGDRTPSDVIWKLVQDHHAKRTDPPTIGWSIEPSEGLSSGGIVIPDGLRLRMRYKTNDYTYADLRDGKLWIGKKTFSSPSAAATFVAQSGGAKGRAANMNGWLRWEFETPKGSGNWRVLDSLRGPWEVTKRRTR